MKKILHIISQYPGRTGSGVYLNQLIKEGHKKNYNQALIGAINKGDSYTNDYIASENIHLLEFNTEDLPFYLVGMSDEMPYESKKYRDMDERDIYIYKKYFKDLIKSVLEEFEPDIIFTHHLWIVSSMVKDLAGDVKVIGLCHGTDIKQFKELDCLSRLVKDGCQKLDLVLALNKSQKEEIINCYSIKEDNIVIVGGGYSGDIFYPSFKVQEKTRIIYAGKVSYAKGLLPGLKAIDKVDEKYDFKFTIVGRGVGKQYEDILRLSRKLDRQVEFLGEVEQEELARIFRESHIFIMPSYYEGLSLVTIEAIASGLLVVSNNLRGLREFLGEDINNSGIIRYSEAEDESGYIEALRANIEKQLESLQAREKIYRSIEKDIEVRSWEVIYRHIMETIEKI